MQTTVKVAISLPKPQFQMAEKRRRLLHVSRSAMVREAISQWLEAFEEQQSIRRYVNGYLRRPESLKGWKAVEKMQALAAAKVIGHEAW